MKKEVKFMRIMGTTLVIAAISLCSNVALAQSVSLGPLVGFSKSSDTDAKVLFGAALRAKFLPALAIEGSINYRQDEFADNTVTVRSWPVQVTGLFYPLPIAYAAVGAGWYNTSFDFDDSLNLNNDTQQEFGWHFGGGLEIPLATVAKLAVDLRYVFIDYKFETVPGVGDAKDDFYMATAGVLFNL